MVKSGLTLSHGVIFAKLHQTHKVIQATSYSKKLQTTTSKYIVFLTDGMKRDNKTRISWWTDPFISSLLSDGDGKEPLPFCEVPWDKENPEIKIQVYKLKEKYIIRSLHPQSRKVAPHKDAIINLIEMIEKGTQPGKCS